jgi:hypothetical protein
MPRALFRFLPPAAAALLVIVHALPVRAQDADLAARVQQLETQVQMLQQQLMRMQQMPGRPGMMQQMPMMMDMMANCPMMGMMGMPQGQMPMMDQGMGPGMGMGQGMMMGPGGQMAMNPAAQAFWQANRTMHQAMMTALTGDADRDFVNSMIPHHQGAIDMARIVLAHGKDPEVKKLAEAVIAAQSAEIEQMKAWLAQHPQ